MPKMVGEFMKINQEDINTLDLGKKIRKMVMADKKHLLLSTKVILLATKKKDLVSLQKMELDMKSLGKMIKKMGLGKELKRMDNRSKYTISMELNQLQKIIV